MSEQTNATTSEENVETITVESTEAINEPKENKTYTQEEFNKMSSSQYQAGINKALKQIGIDPKQAGDYKAKLQAFKDWEDSQKTDIDKAYEAREMAEKALHEEQNKSALLGKRLTAISKGIPSDKADKFIKLAEAYQSEKVDFENALEFALKDFPVKAESRPQIKAVSSTKGGGLVGDGLDAEIAQAQENYKKRPNIDNQARLSGLLMKRRNK